MLISISLVVDDLRKDGCLIDSVFCGDKLISGISYDSRKIEKGDLFCCVPGVHNDGHKYALSAISCGASALMTEKPMPEIPGDFPLIIVKDVRKAMGIAAASLLQHPVENLSMIAITGTNGKSTTTYMLRSILQRAGIKAGLMGTILYDDGVDSVAADRTTPEGPDVQKILARMVENKLPCCVMEASSHGIVQGRLAGCAFNIAGFTNLTEEHLDYHGDIDSYFEAKYTLFSEYLKSDSVAVLNVDNFYGRKIAERLKRKGTKCITYAINSEADFKACNVVSEVKGITFDLKIDNKSHVINLPLIGLYNVENALLAAASSFAMEIPLEIIADGLSFAPTVPGRMEKYGFNGGPCAVVDYAHTPDALCNLLSSLRPVCKGSLVSVFGLGGERFRENRWNMGEIAATLADKMIITMDNPRGEKPEAIAEDVLKGVRKVSGGAVWQVVLDRKEAVRKALGEASEEDIVVISGKGPENYILIGSEKIPYSDSETVVEWGTERGLSWL